MDLFSIFLSKEVQISQTVATHKVIEAFAYMQYKPWECILFGSNSIDAFRFFRKILNLF